MKNTLIRSFHDQHPVSSYNVSTVSRQSSKRRNDGFAFGRPCSLFLKKSFRPIFLGGLSFREWIRESGRQYY